MALQINSKNYKNIKKLHIFFNSFKVDNILNFINLVEFGYGTMRSTDGLCTTDRFSIFKVQIVDPTGQNIFHMKI
jgi:hypothetical protein